MSCDRYADIRTQLMDGILGIVTTQGFGGKLSNGDKASDFDCFSNHTKLQVILGRRIGDAAAEKAIDKAVKLFIREAWLRRKDIRTHLNALLGKNDV